MAEVCIAALNKSFFMVVLSFKRDPQTGGCKVLDKTASN